MRSFIAFAAVCAAINGHPAFADVSAKQEAVRIEMDQEAKAFVFVIDDEPVAMLNKDGLHVVEDIKYGRSLTDTGPDWIKEKIANHRTEVAHD